MKLWRVIVTVDLRGRSEQEIVLLDEAAPDESHPDVMTAAETLSDSIACDRRRRDVSVRVSEIGNVSPDALAGLSESDLDRLDPDLIDELLEDYERRLRTVGTGEYRAACEQQGQGRLFEEVA